MSTCPSLQVLEALISQQLATDESDIVAAHVETSPSCQAHLDQGNGLVPIAAPKPVDRDDATAEDWDDLRRARVVNGVLGDTTVAVQSGAETEQAGAQIAGRYTLQKPIGEGGMGEVWAAEQVRPVRRRVALKLIKAGMDSKSVLGRFDAERQALAVMDHPNIARVYDGGTTERGRPFFAMEYVDGVSLTAFCDEAELDMSARLALFVTICQAVQHAHQKGVIHRDLKPSNILVGWRDGVPVPKIIDFGLAKALHQPLTDQSQFTTHDMMVGTPAYMSPEQAEFNSLDVDTRTDVYALGVVLYQLLTGTTPLEQERIRDLPLPDLLQLIREEEPPRPSVRISSPQSVSQQSASRSFNPVTQSRQVRGELDWIVMKCLEKDRTRRYESASALARDIERHLNDERVEACPPSLGYQIRKTIRRHRGMVLTLSMVLLAIVGGLVGMAWGFLEARDQRDQAERALAEKDKQWQRAEDNAAEARRQKAEVSRQKTEVEQRAAIAQAVNDFLNNDLIGQHDVRYEPGKTAQLTVRELLDRASHTIESAFPEQPLVEAAVRMSLSNAYDGIGDLMKSRLHGERAYRLRRQHLGPEHPDTLESEIGYAVSLSMTGDREKSLPLFEEVVATATRILGSDAEKTLKYRQNLAYNYGAAGRLEDAEQIFLHLLAGHTRKLGPDAWKTIWVRGELGLIYTRWQKYDKAEQHLIPVVEWWQANTAFDNPQAHRFGMYLADCYRRQGKHDLAEPLFQKAVDGWTSSYGPDYSYTLLAKIGLAFACAAQQKYDRADAVYRDVFDHVRRRAGTTSADGLLTLNDFSWLPSADQVAGPQTGLLLFQSALEASRHVHGADDAATTQLLATVKQIREAPAQKEPLPKRRARPLTYRQADSIELILFPHGSVVHCNVSAEDCLCTDAQMNDFSSRFRGVHTFVQSSGSGGQTDFATAFPNGHRRLIDRRLVWACHQIRSPWIADEVEIPEHLLGGAEATATERLARAHAWAVASGHVTAIPCFQSTRGSDGTRLCRVLPVPQHPTNPVRVVRITPQDLPDVFHREPFESTENHSVFRRALTWLEASEYARDYAAAYPVVAMGEEP